MMDLELLLRKVASALVAGLLSQLLPMFPPPPLLHLTPSWQPECFLPFILILTSESDSDSWSHLGSVKSLAGFCGCLDASILGASGPCPLALSFSSANFAHSLVFGECWNSKDNHRKYFLLEGFLVPLESASIQAHPGILRFEKEEKHLRASSRKYCSVTTAS